MIAITGCGRSRPSSSAEPTNAPDATLEVVDASGQPGLARGIAARSASPNEHRTRAGDGDLEAWGQTLRLARATARRRTPRPSRESSAGRIRRGGSSRTEEVLRALQVAPFVAESTECLRFSRGSVHRVGRAFSVARRAPASLCTQVGNGRPRDRQSRKVAVARKMVQIELRSSLAADCPHPFFPASRRCG
jgi:hypothetical protein